jgi:hypothetical protein
MTAIAVPLRRLGSGTLSLRLPRATPGRLSFLLYAALGGYLALVLHAYHGDAYSRVANAYYVLFSRDPHLAAMGFVWTPLPSLFEMAFLPAKIIWPGIAQLGLPAVLMSSTFMALAVREMDLILRDFGLGRATRLGLVAAFALNPAIVYYGAIGTSEAPTLFFALLACRNLARYAGTSSTASLVGVGFALAGAFLTRYEAVPAAVGVAGAITVLALVRLPGTVRERLERAGADIAVALMPFVLVFVGWSLASWIIIGSPFVQFTSDYGNSSQMRVWAAAGANEIGLALGPSIVLAGLRLGALSVVAPIALLAALWALIARRDYRVLAIGAVLGPVLAFMVAAYLFHMLAPWLRYFISVVPLGILLVGVVIAPRAGSQGADSSDGQWRATMVRARLRLATGLAVLASRLTDRAAIMAPRITATLGALAIWASGRAATLAPLRPKLTAKLATLTTTLAPLRPKLTAKLATITRMLAPVTTNLAPLPARVAELSIWASGRAARLARWVAARLADVAASVGTRAPVVGRQAMRLGRFAIRRAPRLAALVPAAALGLTLLSVPVAAIGMLDRTVAVEEARDIGALLGPQAAAADRPGAALRTFAGERSVASYLDAMNLPRGAVLMDVFSAFPIALWSDHPEQFVITTDHDFKQALADPPAFGVRYLLVPSTEGNGVMDAVNRAYPDLAIAHGFATIVHTFPGFGTSTTWSLYELTAP